jgi:hypothetical protein
MINLRLRATQKTALLLTLSINLYLNKAITV